MPNELFLFPDAILYGLVAYLSKLVYWQQIAYALLQTALLLTSLIFLCTSVRLKKPLVVGSAVGSLFVFFALTYDRPFPLLFASVNHYGTFITAILFVSMCLLLNRGLLGRIRLVAISALCVLSFVAALSDDMFIVQVIAPFLLISLLAIATRSIDRSRFALQLLPIATGIAGFWCHVLVNSVQKSAGIEVGVGIRIGVHNASANIVGIIVLLENMCAKAPPIFAVFCLYAGLLVWLISMRLRRRNSGLGDALEWLLVFSFFSESISLASMIFVETFPPADRYFIAIASLPIVVVTLCLYKVVGRVGFEVLNVIVLLPYVLMLIGCVVLIRTNGIQSEYYSPTMGCIDAAIRANRAANGIANYWDAKPIQLLSKTSGLQLAQYRYPLSPDDWETTRRYFRDRYDFAIIALDMPEPWRLSMDQLDALNGPPLRVTCGDRTLLFYGKDQMKLK